MSAVAAICGKRSIFEEIHNSPPSSKRFCFGAEPSSRLHSSRSPASYRGHLGERDASPPKFAFGTASLFTSEDKRRHLQALFPHMDAEVIRGALDNCGNNIEDAIRFLTSLSLDPTGKVSDAAYAATVLRTGRAARPHSLQTSSPATPISDREQRQDAGESERAEHLLSQPSGQLAQPASCPPVGQVAEPPASSGNLLESQGGSARQQLQREHDQQQQPQETATTAGGGVAGASSAPAGTTLNMSSEEGAKWVELLMQEMATAGGLDDARARATKILLGFGAVIQQKGAEECARLQMEKAQMKLSIDQLVHDSSILKRAVQIQNQRVQELQSHERELVQLREAVTHFQEQLKAAEKSNYALSVHLRQAQQASSLPRHFHPDVF